MKESERLLASGQCHVTDEAYIELRKEENEKVAAETLTQQHQEWKKKETEDRKAYNKMLEANWGQNIVVRLFR